MEIIEMRMFFWMKVTNDLVYKPYSYFCMERAL